LEKKLDTELETYKIPLSAYHQEEENNFLYNTFSPDYQIITC